MNGRVLELDDVPVHPLYDLVDLDNQAEVQDDADTGYGTFGREDRDSKKDAKLTLDELNALVVRELKKEGSIRFAGLGIFRKRKLKARMGRNPATGEQIKIPAHATALHPRQGAQGLGTGGNCHGSEVEIGLR
jgi:nucleoid DNA-binding protein